MSITRLCQDEYLSLRENFVYICYAEPSPGHTFSVNAGKIIPDNAGMISYVGDNISYVGLIISYVGFIISYVGLIISYVGDIITYVGLTCSKSYVGLLFLFFTCGINTPPYIRPLYIALTNHMRTHATLMLTENIGVQFCT